MKILIENISNYLNVDYNIVLIIFICLGVLLIMMLLRFLVHFMQDIGYLGSTLFSIGSLFVRFILFVIKLVFKIVFFPIYLFIEIRENISLNDYIIKSFDNMEVI